jgi:hypothetical protein
VSSSPTRLLFVLFASSSLCACGAGMQLVHMISGKMVSGGSQHTNTESLMGCCMDCFKNRALMADAVKAPES